MLAGVGERLAHRSGQRGHRILSQAEVVGHKHLHATVEGVLEAGGGRPQGSAQVGGGRLGPEQELPQLPLLLPGQPRQGRVGGPPLHHGQRLEHTVVQGAGHLLTGPGARHFLAGSHQQPVDVAGHAAGQGVEDDGGGERQHGRVAVVRHVVEHGGQDPGGAHGGAGGHSGAGAEGDAGAQDAHQRPARADRLARLEHRRGRPGQAVEGDQSQAHGQLGQYRRRLQEAAQAGAPQAGVDDRHDHGGAHQHGGQPRVGQVVARHGQHDRHPRPRHPPEHGQPLEDGALHAANVTDCA